MIERPTRIGVQLAPQYITMQQAVDPARHLLPPHRRTRSSTA